MKLLHTSDWHLGRVLHERSLLEDQRGMLTWLAALLEAEPHDALVVAGDVFDRGVPPEAAVELLTEFLRDVRARAPALTVLFIAGNHDSGSRLAFGAPLLAGLGVHLRGGVSDLATPVRVAGAELWAVPFLWPGAFEAAPTQAAAFAEARRRILAAQSPGEAQVMVAHCFAAGGTVSDSERTLVGQSTRIEGELLGGFDYVALGHLHRPQRVAEQVRYSGSPLRYSFSEQADTKVVLSVEVLPGQPPRVTPIPVPQPRPMVTLRGELAALRTDASFAEHEQAYVRVELTDEGPVSQPVPLLRRRFQHLLELALSASAATSGPGAPRARRSPGDRSSLEEDFVAFERDLRGEGAPSADVLAAFRGLVAERAARVED
ncbi:MAG: exonuclease SbcCD subunit D [Deltaproteobacteria bacterium]|nr:exonuclease SbcCD subunit D [Deltaproteobacteria bacterium]